MLYRPTDRPRSRAVRALAASLGIALAAGTAAFTVPPALAATGAIEQPQIEVVSDGDLTQSPVVDDSTTNGIVGTNDTVCFRWSVASTGVEDGTLSQTLPAGWSWTESSLATLLSDSDLYTSSYTITGQTLTATVSIPEGQSIVLLGPLCAVPSSTAALEAYTPTLTVEDGAGTVQTTATDVTVVGTPKTDLYKVYYRAQTYGTHDFGSGAEDAMYIDFRLTVQLPGGRAQYGATPVAFPDPFTLTDTYTLSPSVPTQDLELIEVSNGTATLSGSDIVVSGASGVGTTPWGVTVRMWFPMDELPVGTETPGFVTVTNTAQLAVPGLTDEDPSNNTAVGSVQSVPRGNGSGQTGKEIYAANDPSAPVFGVDPSTPAGNTTTATNGIVSTDALIYSRFYVGVRDALTGAVISSTRPVLYDFWDPTQQQLTGTEADLYVGEAAGTKLPASEFQVLYTTSDGSAVDPETLTWFPRSDAAFDVTTVRGIRIQYVGDGSADAQYTGNWFLAGVPFDIVAGANITVPDTARYLVAEAPNLPSWTRFVTTATTVLGLSKSVDKPATASGSTLTYTLQPSVSIPLGTTTQSSVTGLTVVDTLPTSIVSVDTSSVNPAWATAITPGDPGPDGIAGTSDDVSGIRLDFTYVGTGGVAETGVALPAIRFSGQTSVIRPASGTVVNVAVVSADGNAQAESVRTATAVTTIAQADVLAKSKIADDPLIEVREPQVSWTNSWYNFQSAAQGLTSFVDVLPYNGDARGTDFHGTATLAQATVLGVDSATYILEYTTDAPATIADAPSASTTWLPAPAGGDFSGVTGVTALRVTIPSFAAGEQGVGGLRVVLDVVGQLEDDVYANTLTGRIGIDPTDPTVGKDFPDGPPVIVEVVGSDISGRVWLDADGDGTDDGESGIPGVELALLAADGTPVYELDGVTPVTTTTDANGDYVFLGFPSGQYRVTAVAPTGAVNTYDLDGTLDSDSGLFPLGVDSETNDVDFGYRFFGGLVINKVIAGPGGELFGTGPFVFDVVCTFDGDTVLQQSVTLTPTAGATSVTSAPFTGLPEGTSCTVTETDNGGADSTPAPVTVEIVTGPLGESVIAELTNSFSAGVLDVTKVLDGTAADDETIRALEFDVLVTCQVATTDASGAEIIGTVFSGTVTLTGGETVTVTNAAGDTVVLPLGARCFGEETEARGASEAVVDFDSYENAAVVGTSETQQRLTITATNTFDLAEITVTKIVKGDGSKGPFTFEVECTYDGAPYALADADAAFSLSHGESRVIAVPVGAECTVTETNIPADIDMTMEDTDDTTEGGATDGTVVATPEGQTVTVTNHHTIVSPTHPDVLAWTGLDVNLRGLLFGALAIAAAGAVLLALVAWRRRKAAGSPE